jgi:hypothetical protein
MGDPSVEADAKRGPSDYYSEPEMRLVIPWVSAGYGDNFAQRIDPSDVHRISNKTFVLWKSLLLRLVGHRQNSGLPKRRA